MTNMGDVSDEIKSITVLPDGKIVAIGISSFYTFALARYNPDGNLDTSFGNGGKVFTYFGSNRVASLGGAVQPDGKIIVAGEVNINSGWDFALARYNTNGSLDTSFGTSGKVTTDILLNDAAYAVVVQPDGKIVVGGYAGSSPDVHADFGLARYNSNGSLDTSYGTGGKVITDFVGNSDFIQSMQLQPDGKIVAAGYTQAQPHVQYALARYDSTGALDSTFGTGGKSPPIWAGPPQVRR